MFRAGLRLMKPAHIRRVSALSTRARQGPFPALQHAPNTVTGKNTNRSYEWLFEAAGGHAAVTESVVASETQSTEEQNAQVLKAAVAALKISAAENVTSPNANLTLDTKATAASSTSMSNQLNSFDFLFAEIRSPFGTSAAMKEWNRSKSAEYLFEGTPNEQTNLLKVLHTLVEQNTAAISEVDESSSAPDKAVIRAMNRNARAPKKANHGRRPCSHVARRSKRMKRHKGW